MERDCEPPRKLDLELPGCAALNPHRGGAALINGVALTRPHAAAARSAALLRARGFEPLFAPVMDVVATGQQPPVGKFDAVIATSSNVFAFLSRSAIERLADQGLCVAGDRTAESAVAAGLRVVQVAAGAQSLAASLAARPAQSRFLYLAGRDRKVEVEGVLAAAGHRVVAIEIYAAEARSAWGKTEVAAFGACDAALHYSRRSAELTIALAEGAGLGDHLRTTLHACISKDAAEPLRLHGARRIVVASSAQEPLLIDALSLAIKIS
jgi:uroporphyrinogen-III synthase